MDLFLESPLGWEGGLAGVIVCQMFAAMVGHFMFSHFFKTTFVYFFVLLLFHFCFTPFSFLFGEKNVTTYFKGNLFVEKIFQNYFWDCSSIT